jgi:hypothetical protein
VDEALSISFAMAQAAALPLAPSRKNPDWVIFTSLNRVRFTRDWKKG